MVNPGKLLRDNIAKHLPKFGTIGETVPYRVTVDAAYDATTGAVNAGLTTVYPVYAIFETMGTSATSAGDSQIDDSAPISIDRLMTFAAKPLPVTPKIGDLVDYDSLVWRVMNVNRDPVPAHWALHIRPVKPL